LTLGAAFQITANSPGSGRWFDVPPTGRIPVYCCRSAWLVDRLLPGANVRKPRRRLSLSLRHLSFTGRSRRWPDRAESTLSRGLPRPEALAVSPVTVLSCPTTSRIHSML